jgi:hypothetical protein
VEVGTGCVGGGDRPGERWWGEEIEPVRELVIIWKYDLAWSLILRVGLLDSDGKVDLRVVVVGHPATCTRE